MPTVDEYLNPATPPPDIPGVPGAAVNGPANPPSTPPGVNTADPGRPSTTPPAFGTVAVPASGAVSPPPGASQAPPSTTPAAKPQGMKINVTMPPEPGVQAPETAPRAVVGPEGVAVQHMQPQPAAPPGPPQFDSDRVPQEHELDLMPAGAVVNTPIGSVTRDPAGNTRVVLNEAGKQRYRETVAATIKEYGDYPFSTNPDAPKPRVRVGKRNFDPFGNKWVGAGA